MNSFFLRCLFAMLMIIGVTECCAQQSAGKSPGEPFDLFLQGDRYYLRIADSLLGRDILVFSRIVETAQKTFSDLWHCRGAKTVEEVFRFAKGQNGKMALELVCYERHSRAHFSVAQAKNNTGKVIPIAEFDIVSFLKENGTYTLDVDSLINNDNNIIYITNGSRNGLGLNKIERPSFSVASVQVNAGSIEIRTTRKADNRLLLDLNTSLYILPKIPMRARFADSRLNYFEQAVTEFGPVDSKRPVRSMITRWRLEPKAQDQAKYDKGQLVEPAKPIIYYIDTATPEKWVQYFIQGVEDWQAAFEKAGFKNAILARRIPKDSLFVLNDSRYSIIRYNPINVEDATYSYVVDPRSSEIVQSNIIWSERVVDYYQNRYIILLSPVDKKARNPELADSIKGEIIRFVVQHEIGHSLGFEHNYIASNSVSVSKLRDKKWVEKNGIASSIMDYARFNYVAQPGDNITARKGLINSIGVYDEWAIKWGYTLFPAGVSENAEKAILEKWIQQRSSAREFRDGETLDEDDPRAQSEDLGDDAMLAGEYGIKNLQFVITELTRWSEDSSCKKSRLVDLYDQLIYEYNYYISHALTSLTGTYISAPASGQTTMTPVSSDQRKRALEFIEKHFYSTPEWLINPSVLQSIGLSGENILNRIHTRFLNRSLSQYTLSKIQRRESDNYSYTLAQYLRDLSQSLFKDVALEHSTDKHRQTLQKSYIKGLIKLIPARLPIDTSSSQYWVAAKVRTELVTLRSQLKALVAKTSDAGDVAYLQNLLEPLNKF
jgi:hypothetical protein